MPLVDARRVVTDQRSVGSYMLTAWRRSFGQGQHYAGGHLLPAIKLQYSISIPCPEGPRNTVISLALDRSEQKSQRGTFESFPCQWIAMIAPTGVMRFAPTTTEMDFSAPIN